MFFKNVHSPPLLELVKESQNLKKKIETNDFSTPIQLASVNSPEAQEIVQNVNVALEAMVKFAQNTELRLQLVTKAIQVGLWDMTIEAGDPINPKNEFIWSDELRKMLGFRDETDFPNVLDSWASRIHSEDHEWVLQAFADHLNDHSGRTPYNIEYRLILKSGECRWFRATGTTTRDSKGMPLRVVGALFDIHKEKLDNQRLEALVTRYDLINQALEEAPWDMTVIAGDPVNPNNEFWWSPQIQENTWF